MKKVLIFLLIFLLLPFTLKLKGQDFGSGQSLFSDIKAHSVGDILMVNIVEQNRATSQVESKTEKGGSFGASTSQGLGPLDFIPLMGASGKLDYGFDGKGENLRSGSVRAKMSVTVTKIRPNGDLVIEGTRVLGISGDTETLTLKGVIRTKDITPDNTIQSYLIAEAEVTYTGKGNTNTGARPGILQRGESGRRHADHQIAAWQPHPVGRLAPKGLGLDDLAKLHVVGAEIPAVCINLYHLIVRSIPSA